MIRHSAATRLSVCGVSDKGAVRPNNEDNFYVDGLYPTRARMFDGNTVTVESPEADISGTHIYAVFDGMGGEEMGEMASETAVRALSDKRTENCRPEDMIPIIDAINTAVRQTAVILGVNKCGCTAAIVLLDSGDLYTYNVGDSRVYLLHDHRLVQLTKDDTVAQSLYESSHLTKEGMRTSRTKHLLIQNIGLDKEKDKIFVHCRRSVTLSKNDRILICSDGITDALTNQRIKELLRADADAEELAASLVDEALKSGCDDNVTAVVIKAH